MELAQLRAELAHAYFIFKKDEKSLRQARISISLSGHKNALAFWSGGLASWRLGNLKQSKCGDLNLRTVVKLPNGSGKKNKIAVLCEQEKVEEAKKIGADVAGSQDLLDKISFKDLIFIYLELEAQGRGMNFKHTFSQSKYPQIIA